MSSIDDLKSDFIKACQELFDNQNIFYYCMRNGVSDMTNFHPNVKDNPYIGAYFKAREALEKATNQRYTVMPDLVKEMQ